MEPEYTTADLKLSVAESKSLLKVVFAASQDAIAIYGANGELLSHNAAWIRLMGDWHNGSLGKSVRDAARVSGYKGPSSFYRAIRSGLPESILINTRHDVVLVTATPHFVGEILQHVMIIARNLTQLASLKDQLESQRAGTCTRVEDARTEHLKSILETAGLSNIIVAGSSFRNLLLLVSQVAVLDATVLLYGETGTGKGVVAKVLHRLSRRADKPFIEVNCGAIPDSLAESGLFGYQPGAFTDSLRGGKKGQIELANKETLFLDEVSELSISSQVKLLKFLDDKVVFPLGATKPIAVDVRVVAASNRDLHKMIQDGKFREDLLYRLEVVPLTVPPLRERRGEISFLLHAFFHQYTQEFGEQRTISPGALRVLEDYDFPGNVRELRNLAARMIICSRNSVIDICDLPERVQKQTAAHTHRFERQTAKPADSAAQIPLKKQLQDTERNILERYAHECRSIREVARYLGLNPSSVVRKMRKYKRVMGSGGV